MLKPIPIKYFADHIHMANLKTLFTPAAYLHKMLKPHDKRITKKRGENLQSSPQPISKIFKLLMIISSSFPQTHQTSSDYRADQECFQGDTAH